MMTWTQLQNQLNNSYQNLVNKLILGTLSDKDMIIISSLTEKWLLEQNTIQGTYKASLDQNLKIFNRGKIKALKDELNAISDFDETIIMTKLNKYNNQWLDVETKLIKNNINTNRDYEQFLKQKDRGYVIEWVATKDEKTRDSHRAMDGVRKKVDDPFWQIHGMPGTAANCYDKDTRVYTNTGLKYFYDLKEEDLILSLNPDTQNVEYLKPINYIKKYEETILEYKNENFHISASKNHQMFYIPRWDIDSKKDDKIFKKCDFKDIPNRAYIYKTSKYDNINDDVIINGVKWKQESLAKLMGWYLSEGSTTKIKDKENVIQSKISQSKYLELLIEDSKEFEHNWHIANDYIGCNDKRITEYLNKFGKSDEKWIPEEIKNMSRDNIKLFLNRYMLGDGSFSNKELGTGCIYTSSERMMNDLIEIVIKSGYSVSISKSNRKGKEVKHRNDIYTTNHDIYNIFVNINEYNMIKKKEIEEVSYSDYVYDVELPKNHILLVERSGKLYWSGNCRCTYRMIKADEKGDIAKEVYEENDSIDLKNIYSNGVIFGDENRFIKYGEK